MIQQAILLFIGVPEVMIIMVVVVMVFGADKIPEIARGLGKGMRTLKDATTDIKQEVARSANLGTDIKTDVAKDINEELNKVKDDLQDFTGSLKREK